MSELPPGLRRCPHCAEAIRVEAILCRHCGTLLARETEPGRVGAAIVPLASVVAFPGPGLGRSQPLPTLTTGDRRIATVFIFDLEGYTRLAQEIDPEEVQEFLNEFYAGAISVIEKYDGTVDNIVGDEILAVFGVPVAHDLDPDLALRSACEILDYTRAFNARHPHEVHIHGGVHTGLVVTGELGSQTRSKYSLVGTTVNLAARLVTAARRDEILVSWETYEQTANQFQFEPVGPLKLKDFDRPQRAFRLISLDPKWRGIAPPPRAIRAPFIGRAREMATLRDLFEMPRADGRPGVLAVRGDMGYGKTRLVIEAIARHAPRARAHRGAAAQWARSVGLFAVVDLLRHIVGVFPFEGVAPIEARVAELLRESRAEETVDALCLRHLLGDPLATELLGRESPEQRQRRLFDSVLGLLRALSRDRLLVLFFDDLQWLDPTSEKFLRGLLAAQDLAQCRVVLAARQDESLALLGAEVPTITLGPFSEEESKHLLENVLEQIGVSPALQRLILQRGEGNPLFLEELARMVRSDLLEKPPEEQRRVAERLQDEIPQSLQNLIQARVDRLELKTRLVLQCGAVLGREFLFESLALIEMIREGLMDKLITLESLEILLRRVDERFLKYYFKNSLTQEVVYRSMLRRQRQQMHETVAAALERLFAKQRREYAAQIAFHWEQAGDRARAAEHLIEAGRRALDLGDLQLAELQVETAIEHLTSLETTSETERLMVEALLFDGVVQRLAGAMDASQVRLHAALTAARHLEDSGLIGMALIELSQTFLQRGRHGWATRVLQRALEIESARGDRRHLALCHQRLAIVAWQQGRTEEARNYCERVTELAPEEDFPAIASDALNNLGLILWHQGHLTEAYVQLERAAALRRRCKQVFGEVATESNLGIICEQMGRFLEASRHYRWALERAKALRYRQVETALHANLANLMITARRWHQGLEHSALAEEIASSIDDRRSVAIALENRALCEMGLENTGASQEALARAAALADQLDDHERQASVALVRGALERARGRTDEAVRATAAAEDLIGRDRLDHLRPALRHLEGLIALDRGERQGAARILREALGLAVASQGQSDEIRIRRDLASRADSLGLSTQERDDNARRLDEIESALRMS
jgi:class 3 adenylate cyclase/tetratricopeptide (TPR) repeat protein